MCGITGAIWTDPKLALEPAALDRMTEALRHRGPDDKGSYTSEYRVRPPYEALPGVALGVCRLSKSIVGRTILSGDIDEARPLKPRGQPISNEDGSVWVVCDGETYNFAPLRRRLEGAGHKFKTNSDTETIVHLYEDEGPDCFEHLNGMFAIAIWDARLRRLVLGRDRLGKKPLVYRHESGRFLFASELKSLLLAPGVPREIDASAVDEYLTYQYIPDPNTIFRGIRKLPPGHCAVLQDSQLEIRSYWRPDFRSELRISETDAALRLQETLDSAVQLRMSSEAPLGALLTGDINSALVAAIMQRHAGQPVKTFSVQLQEGDANAVRHARLVAEHLKTDHHELRATLDVAEIVRRLAQQFDEPFGDSSAVFAWYLAQQAREHVTIALTGDGGDELFAGHPRYRPVALAALFDRSLVVTAFKRLASLGRYNPTSQATSNLPAARRYLDSIGLFNEGQRAELYSDEFLARLPSADPFAFLESAWKRSAGRDVVSSASIADLATYVPCDLLAKIDTCGMAHSLECRQPFLDYRVVELVASLPIGHKYRRGRGGGRILRRAFDALLPREIWNGRQAGPGVPLAHWFRHELKDLTHDLLLAGSTQSQAFFRRETVARLISEHESRRFDHGRRLWALLMFELFLLTVLEHDTI